MRILRHLLLLLVSFLTLLTYNTITLTKRQITENIPPLDPKFNFDSLTEEQLVQRMSEAIQLHSISFEVGATPETEKALLKLHDKLESFFPVIHQQLKKVLLFITYIQDVVAKYSLLYTWEGSDPSLKPIMLCGWLVLA